MEPLERYKDPELVRALCERIKIDAKGLPPVRIMHVCGTHEYSVNHFGIRDLLPKNITIVAGPGCPVCVCPVGDILAAKKIVEAKEAIIATYGDMLNVPTPEGSLLESKSKNNNVRVVYSVADAVTLAKAEPTKEVVFFSIGFETTTVTTAAAMMTKPPENFSLIVSNRTIPAALEFLSSNKALNIGAYILPGHVSVILGEDLYGYIPQRYNIPCAIAGFEPVDVLEAVSSIVGQIKDSNPIIHNAYKRAVSKGGNTIASRFMNEVFDECDAYWRGLGILPKTGLKLSKSYDKHDAYKKFGIEPDYKGDEFSKGCLCPLIMTGEKTPENCPAFGKSCTPASPVGPCMVSDEGTCKIWLDHKGL